MRAELLATLIASFFAVMLGCLAFAGLMREHGRRWRQRFDDELGGALRQSFVYLDPGRLFRLQAVIVCAVSGLAWFVSGRLEAVAVAVIGAGALPGIALARLRHRRLQRLAEQLPDAVMLVAGALRAGASLVQAIAQASRELSAPAGREFDLIVREQRLGMGMEGSMLALERRIPLEPAALFAAAVRIAQDTGGNLAETLERLADTLRRKASLEGRIDALTAQGRLQGWVMAALPLAVGAALFVIEPVAMRPLVSTWQGWATCAVVLLLEGLGLHFIRRIVDIDV